MQISTWRTDAGDLDVRTDMPAADGRRLRYDDLIRRAAVIEILGGNAHVAAPERLSPGAPATAIRSRFWTLAREALDRRPNRSPVRVLRPVNSYHGDVSDAAHHQDEVPPQGTSLLPPELTPGQLAQAPVLASIDVLLIDDLSDDEDDAFAAALDR